MGGVDNPNGELPSYIIGADSSNVHLLRKGANFRHNRGIE